MGTPGDALPISSVGLPAMRISTPTNVDYHMILDQELSMLTDPPTTALSSIGFTFVGAALGSALNFYAAIDKLSAGGFTTTDFVATVFFTLSIAGGIACLGVYAMLKRHSRNLADTIRGRDKHPAGA